MTWQDEPELRAATATAEKIAITLSLITIIASGIGYVAIISDIENYSNRYEQLASEYAILMHDSEDALHDVVMQDVSLLRREKRQEEYARYRGRPAHRTQVDFAVDEDLAEERVEDEEADSDRKQEAIDRTNRERNGEERDRGYSTGMLSTDDEGEQEDRDRDRVAIHETGPRICDCSRIRCPRGPPGPPGRDGFPANDGDPGIPGRPGVDGIYQVEMECPPCPPGKRGDRGKTGESGPIGVPGIPGKPGTDGTNEKGPPGEDGPRGRPGRPGRKGATGELGQDAVQLLGVQGPKGRQGPRGFTGPRGDPGKNGISARPGPEGAPGIRGEIGEQGAPGLPGPTGRVGAHGKDGGYCNCPSRNGDDPLGFNRDFDPAEYPKAGHYEEISGSRNVDQTQTNRQGETVSSSRPQFDKSETYVEEPREGIPRYGPSPSVNADGFQRDHDSYVIRPVSARHHYHTNRHKQAARGAQLQEVKAKVNHQKRPTSGRESVIEFDL